MNEQHYYTTIEKAAVAELRERGSRFIAHAYPIASVDNFKQFLHQLKKEHPKAVHHCFAYRLGMDGNTFRVSDDGEPSGTAGKPILGQLDSKGIIDAAVIVVRYFGGTLLGVPGLINAYKSAASMALQLTPMVKKLVMVNGRLSFNYTQINEVMTIVKHFGCEVQSQENLLFCSLQVAIPKSRLEEMRSKIKDLRAVELDTV